MTDGVAYIEKVVTAMRTDPEVVALFPERLQGLAPFYIPGHKLYISTELTKQNVDQIFKEQKYPLIALLMDYPEQPLNGLITYNFHIVILNLTEANYTIQQRYEVNFRPLLQPLYEKFISILIRVGKFVWTGDRGNPPHSKVDRPYWGVVYEQGNAKYVFNDRLDAIEITDLRLSKTIKNCE